MRVRTFVATLAVVAFASSHAFAQLVTPVQTTPPPPQPKPDAPVTSDTSAPAVPGSPQAPVKDEHEGRFEFGSYGRVYAASDLRGGTGRGTNVVAFGPRIVDEGDYAEIEFRREDTWNPRVKSRIVTTLGLFPPFFHFSGKTDQMFGLRNL
ncbi:MAG TPA: hypothetical protein VIF62_20075, partial [Labilithrix sp.]